MILKSIPGPNQGLKTQADALILGSQKLASLQDAMLETSLEDMDIGEEVLGSRDVIFKNF